MTDPKLSQSPAAISHMTYLTADLPGIGGRIKTRMEDFLVEEQPMYEPVGHGEHLYLFFEKFNLATPDAIRAIAKAFRVSRRDVGYAGLKDKRAITRQHVSIYLPKADPDFEQDCVRRVEHHPNITVLWTQRHENKLRLGHLAGNRFVIYIREVDPSSVVQAKRILDRLIVSGIPNFFGEQRFGYRENSHRIGRCILLNDGRGALDHLLGMPSEAETEQRSRGREAYEAGDYDTALALCPKRLRFERQALDGLRQGKTHDEALRFIDRAQRELMLSAWQSSLFNRVLHRRLNDGTFDRLVPGDLAQQHHNRAVFAVDDEVAKTENAPGGRIESFEISPSGPMWGPEMMQATAAVGELEQAVLEDDGLTRDDLTPPADVKLVGQRRPLRVPMRDPDISAGVDEKGPYVRVAFELPRGSFATVALREIMKDE